MLRWTLALLPLLAFAQNVVDVRPSPQQIAWQQLEFGVLIHFGTNTFLDREWGDGTASPDVFNPTALDAEQWVTAAKAAGARYLIMVAKHHDGFCLWPSRHTKYTVAASPYKKDVLRQVSDACQKHGLQFGVYLSPWDRNAPSYSDNRAYDDYYTRQITELASRYGPITEFWLDGAGSEGHVYDFRRYIRQLRTYQPNALIFASLDLLPHADIRWVGNEAGYAPEENWNVIDGYEVLRWRPAEADTPLRKGHWFWHPNAESRLKSLDELKDMYHKTAGRGAQLVLGLAPDNRGLMPEVDVARLAEFGAWIRNTYQKPVNPQGGQATDGDPETWFEGNPVLQLNPGARFDRAVIQEYLAEGQRVRRYRIEARQKGQWTTIAQGSTIGHKKIDLFDPITADAVRLVIEAQLAPPRIAEFNVYLEP